MDEQLAAAQQACAAVFYASAYGNTAALAQVKPPACPPQPLSPISHLHPHAAHKLDTPAPYAYQPLLPRHASPSLADVAPRSIPSQ